MVSTANVPELGSVIVDSKLGTTKRKDGSVQVTYAGHPLYIYTADREPGGTRLGSFEFSSPERGESSLG